MSDEEQGIQIVAHRSFALVPDWVSDLVFDGRMKHTSMTVYLALLRFANKDRQCWPSTEKVMALTGVSKNTYHNGLAELQEQGALVVLKRPGRSNRFILPEFQNEGVATSAPLPNSETPPLPKIERGPSQNVRPRTTYTELDPKEPHTYLPEPVVSAQNLPAQRVKPKPAVRGSRAEGFEEFWTIACRKTAKGAARSAYARAVCQADPTIILAAWSVANEVWRTWPPTDRDYIPHPTTWLNQERWDDDPPVPRGATGKPVKVNPFRQLREQEEAESQLRDTWAGTVIVQEGIR